MMRVAIRGTAHLLWSRDRTILLTCALAYGTIFIACLAFPREQVFRHVTPALPVMRLAPFFLPLALMFGATNVATLHIRGREGNFPRFFFTMPIKAREMVLPLIMYCIGLAAVLWLAGALITGGRLLMLSPPGTPPEAETISYWVPFIAASLLAWFQAIIWRPFASGWRRLGVLLAILVAHCVVIFLYAHGTVTQAQVIVAGLLQIPLAALVAIRGVARDRSGGAYEVGGAAQTRARNASEAKAASRRPLRAFSTAMDAQLWFERQVHRGKGVLAYGFLLLLLAIFITLDARGTAATNPVVFGGVARLTIVMSVWIVLAIASAVGFQSASFISANRWQQKHAFAMPSFFAALPLSTGDFVWAKLTAVTTRVLWFSLTGGLVCAWVAARAHVVNFAGAHALAVRQLHGDFAAGAILAAPVVAFVLTLISGAACLMSLTLAGRARNWLNRINWGRYLIMGFGAGAVGGYWTSHKMPPPSLPEILCALAVIKIATIVALVQYVGRQRLLSWSRLAVILALWVAMCAAMLSTALTFVPPDRISLLTLVALLVLLAPVQGTLVAPLALHLNRVR